MYAHAKRKSKNYHDLLTEMWKSLKRNLQILREGWNTADRATRQRHVILFLLHFVTLLFAGEQFSTQGQSNKIHLDPLLYAVALSIILLGYSLARYVQARSYGLFASFPYFIPMPLFSPFGTLGVITRTAPGGADSRALFDIAFWGPATCFLLSLPCVVLGVWLSDIVPGEPQYENPLLVIALAKLFRDLPAGYDLAVHPLLAAGWVGLFFCAINLFPVGNLSGGQIAWALLGRRQRELGYLTLVAVFVLALYYPLWFILVLAFIYIGVEHPQLRRQPHPLFHDLPAEPPQPLDLRRRLMALVPLAIFILSFTMRPFNLGPSAPTLPPQQLSPPEPEIPAPDPEAEEEQSI